MQRGADALELDVRLTADGAPVVIHDETLDRTTDGTGDVAVLSTEYLAGLDNQVASGEADIHRAVDHRSVHQHHAGVAGRPAARVAGAVSARAADFHLLDVGRHPEPVRLVAARGGLHERRPGRHGDRPAEAARHDRRGAPQATARPLSLGRPHIPDSFDGFRLRFCCFAILIDTGSNDVSHVVQHSGRPQDP